MVGGVRRPVDYRITREGCHICISHIAKHTTGYCVLRYKGKQECLHRIAYMEKYGKIRKRFVIMHKCDNKICINPDHLFAGTQKQNMQDMVLKGRQSRGSERHTSKLNADDVRAIRFDMRKNFQIAELYGVSLTTIYKIKAKKSWKWLK